MQGWNYLRYAISLPVKNYFGTILILCWNSIGQRIIYVVQEIRKLITDFDLLPLEKQEEYLKMNIVLPFIIDGLRFKIAI